MTIDSRGLAGCACREIRRLAGSIEVAPAWVASDDRNLHALDPWSGAALWRAAAASAPSTWRPGEAVALPGR